MSGFDDLNPKMVLLKDINPEWIDDVLDPDGGIEPLVSDSYACFGCRRVYRNDDKSHDYWDCIGLARPESK